MIRQAQESLNRHACHKKTSRHWKAGKPAYWVGQDPGEHTLGHCAAQPFRRAQCDVAGSEAGNRIIKSDDQCTLFSKALSRAG